MGTGRMNIFSLAVMTTYSHLSSFFFILYGYFVLFCFALFWFVLSGFGLVWSGLVLVLVWPGLL